MPMKMESGAQTVPTSFMDSSDLNTAGCVPDFDMFLRENDVPSPSSLLYPTSYLDSHDYMLLSSLEESCLMVSDGPFPSKRSRVPESPILRETLAKPSAPLRDQHHRLVVQPPTPPPDSTTTANDSVAMLESLAASVTQGLIKKEPFEVSTTSVSCQGFDCTGGRGHPVTREEESQMTVMVKQELGLSDDYCDQAEMNDASGTWGSIESLIMSHLSNDIGVACEQMGISADPMNWTCDDVYNWIMWTIRQYDLPSVCMEYFQMDGASLCALTDAQFRTMSAQCGETLFANLDLWKSACRSSSEKIQASEAAPVQFKSSFKPEDSLLDMGSYFQWSVIPSSPMATPPREGSVSPDGAAVVPDSSTGHSSDYSSDGGMQSDDDASEDGVEMEVRPVRHSSSHSHIHLWQFLKELLEHPQQYSTCIRWLDRTKGVFKIEDSVRVARLWGKRKNRPAMNYDKLSRSIRQYYKKGIMKKTERSQRLVYQFCHPYSL